MSTPKPKPTFQSMIELPSEQLLLMTITVDPKPAARVAQPTQANRLPAGRLLPHRGKATLH